MKKVIFYFTFITINIFSLESKSENIKSQEIQKIPESTIYKKILPPKSGLINNEGKIILETDYDEIKQLFFTENKQKLTKDGNLDGYQETKTPLKFFYVKSKDKYGIIDKTGKIILKPEQDYLIPTIKVGNKYFFNFQKNQKMGLINENGKIILDPNIGQYELPRKFPNENYTDLATFSKDGLLGVFNSEGKIILDPIYEDINGFENKKSDNFFATKHGVDEIINRNGKIISSSKFESFHMLKNNNRAFAKINKKWGMIDENSKFIIEPIYESLSEYDFKNNISFKKDGKWGIMDENGKILIEAKFDNIGYKFQFNNIRTCYRKDNKSSTEDIEYIPVCINKKWGFIDENGKILIEPKFESVYNFYDGLGYVSIKDENIDKTKAYKRPTYSYYDGEDHNDDSAYYKWGVIDKKGNWIIKPDFNFIYEFSEDLAYVNKEGKFGYINKKGEWVITPQFEQKSSLDEICPTYFENGFAEVFKDKKLNLIDKMGNIYLKYDYPFNMNFSFHFNPPSISEEELKKVDFSDLSKLTFSTVGFVNKDRLVVNYSQWYGLIDRNFKFILEPKYSFIYPDFYNKNYLNVRLNDKVGIADYNGNFILKPIYNQISKKNNFIYFNLNNKYGFSDENYKIISEPKFSFIGDFSEGLAVASINDKYGFINEKGDFVIKPQFDRLSTFSNNLSVFSEGNSYGIIDKAGKIIKKPIFSNLEDFNNNIATFKKNNKYILVDEKGKKITNEEFDEIIYTNTNNLDKNTKSDCNDNDSEWVIVDDFGNIQDNKKIITKEYLIVKKEGYYYLMDKKGKYISKNEF